MNSKRVFFLKSMFVMLFAAVSIVTSTVPSLIHKTQKATALILDRIMAQLLTASFRINCVIDIRMILLIM
ncbi:hypothetical protein BH18THE2_BH18THE2_10110 [soil metagenome]